VGLRSLAEISFFLYIKFTCSGRFSTWLHTFDLVNDVSKSWAEIVFALILGRDVKTLVL
jgi:hypothetical protein